MAASTTIRRLTVGDVERMASAGVFQLDEHVELIGGQLFVMSPIGPEHVAVASAFADLVTRMLGERVLVRSAMPLTLGPYDMPEPDIVVIPRRDDFYRAGGPAPREVHAVIETSDASLAYDRGGKSELYALAGIREYWIVDVNAETIERRREPTPDGRYASIVVARRGDAVAFADFPDVRFRVAALLGLAGER